MNQVLKDGFKVNGIKFYYCNADILTSNKKKELIQDVEKQQPHVVAIYKSYTNTNSMTIQ